MNQTIVSAISGLKVLSLSYDGVARKVEPHAYGVSTAGHDVLRCYQIAGAHRSGKPHDWELLTVSKISALALTGDSFSGPRPGYKRGDKGMTRIYVEL